MVVNCQHCNSPLEINEEWLNMQAQCPICGKNTILQAAVPEPAPVIPAKSNKKWFIAAAAGGAALILLIAVIILLSLKGGESQAQPAPAAEVQTAAKPANAAKTKTASAKPADAAKTKTASAKPANAAKTKPQPPEFSFTIPEIDPFDISQMVSGMPLITPAPEKFDIRKHIAALNPGKSDRDVKSLSEAKWQELADSVLLQVAGSGDVRTLHFMLSRGYDINGLYTFDSKQYNIVDFILRRSRISVHSFIKMYLMLAENGFDLNAKGHQSTPLMVSMLELCDYKGSKMLWRLIPYSIARGAKLDKIMIADANIRNKEFRTFINEVIKRKFTAPTPVEYSRRGKLCQEAMELKLDVKVNQPGLLKVVNVAKPDSHVICKYNPTQVPISTIAEFVKNGGDINTMLLCTSSRHGSRDIHVLHYFLRKNLSTLQFLIANNYCFGIDNFNGFYSWEDYSMLAWENGADITEEHINNASAKDLWEKLITLYKKQKHQFGIELIKPRDLNFWLSKEADIAVNKRDLKKLQDIVSRGFDVNYRENKYARTVLEKLLAADDTQDMINFLFDNGAKAVSPSGKDILNIPALSGKIDNLKLLIRKTGIKLTESRKSELFRDTISSRNYNISKESIAMLDFIMDELKLDKQKAADDFERYKYCNLYDYFLKHVDRYYYNYKECEKIFPWLDKHGFKPSSKVLKNIKIDPKYRTRYPEFINLVERLKQEAGIEN